MTSDGLRNSVRPGVLRVTRSFSPYILQTETGRNTTAYGHNEGKLLLATMTLNEVIAAGPG